MHLDEIRRLDMDHITNYNVRASEQYRLRTELGPCPNEGDINSSPIVLLLANPGFDENSSIDDHKFFVDGWPLGGLHDSAPLGMRDWWQPRLRVLCERYGHQYISTKVAALQVNPWASTKFDSNLNLPSQQKMLELAEVAVERGAILIMMRAAKFWLKSTSVRNHPSLYTTRSPRCSYVTEANLGAQAWFEINSALQRK
jgi:hypothetical protein